MTELTRASAEITNAITTFRFNDAAGAAYKFVWNQLCDWHLELLKPVFMGEDEAAKAEAQAVLAYVLDETYKLLHPFMPFMTEELWGLTAEKRDTLLCHAPWPQLSFADSEAAADINWLIDTVTAIRSIRAEMNVPPATQAPLFVVGANDQTRDRVERLGAAVKRLARVSEIELAGSVPENAVQLVMGEATGCLPLGSLVDLGAETARLAKALEKIDADLRNVMGKLGNERFVANAKPEVVAAERARLAELEGEKLNVEAARARLAAL